MVQKMKQVFLFILATVIVVATLQGCGRAGEHEASGEVIPMRHAQHLHLWRGEGYTIVHLQDPWDTTRVLHAYVLVPRDSVLPSSLPQGTLVRTPCRRLGLSSSVHVALLSELGCSSAVAGVCEPQYVLDHDIRQRVASGEVADLGRASNPSIERLMDAHPDALLLTPFAGSGGYGKAEALGIPIIETAEYMETTALGEAEWMRFYALLLGEEARGDSLFGAIEARYLSSASAARRLAPHRARRPRVLTEMMTSGTWYVPGGQSTIAHMIADAGGDYVFAARPESGSVALTFETVLSQGAEADVWLIKYSDDTPLTLHQLSSDYAPYSRFRAFETRQVWGCNLSDNRYYTDIPFHPDRLLDELIHIFGATDTTNTYGYYERLQ